ncbi:MAG: hypothetical protein ACYDCO_01240 [Armatimonadota bacterium]
MHTQHDRMLDNRTLGSTTYPTRHLFIDIDNLVEWGPRVFQHFPKPEKVPLTGLECGPAGSWDARIAIEWGSVLFDEGRFRYWGCCQPGIERLDENADVPLNLYAESEDGIHWTKPDLKITGQQRWPGNNLLSLPGTVMSVVRALPGAPFRYLALSVQVIPLYPGVSDTGEYEFNGPGTYLFGSDDGLHWVQMTKHPMVYHGDWAALHVDPVQGCYLLYQKTGACHGLASRRAMIVMESTDAIHWEGYHGYRRWHETLLCDDLDDQIAAAHGYRIAEFYGHAIHQVDTLYLALQTMMLVGDPLVRYGGQNPNGHALIRPAFSHDGIVWRYPAGRPTLVEPGQPGEWDAGFMVTTTNVLEQGDHMWVYYSAYQPDHGWGITTNFHIDPTIDFAAQNNRNTPGLLRLKRDRFASLGANQPDAFDVEIGPKQGKDFTLNAITRNRGSVRVAFAEAVNPLHLSPRKTDSLPGFSFDDCILFQGDEVRAPVRFAQKTVADLPEGVNLILRVQVDAAEVFGYEWHDAAG